MKHTLLILIPILFGCSNGTDNQRLIQIDSLNSIIRQKNLEIDSLKKEFLDTQDLIQRNEDEQQKSNITELEGCECNLSNVRIVNQSMSKLTEDILFRLLCTFNDKCKNNVEFGEYSNETLHEVISERTELFIATMHENRNKLNLRLILDEIETPIHDGFDLEANYRAVKGVYGYESTKDTILRSIEISMTKFNINYFEADDCTFDLSTQNDDFLRDIPELENYTWNKHINSAKVQLNQDEILFISRGGCDHFGVSAEFHINGNKVDLDQAFDKILWIAGALDQEFEFDLLKEAIEKKNYTSEDPSYMSFSNQRLSDLNYSMSVKYDDGLSEISLSWYMN